MYSANPYNIYKQNSVNMASSQQLLLMLLDGAVKYTKIARMAIVKKDYEIDLDDEFIKELDIKDEKDVLVLCLITLGKTLKDSTANLKAPIIINIKNNRGKQLILQDDKYKSKKH